MKTVDLSYSNIYFNFDECFNKDRTEDRVKKYFN